MVDACEWGNEPSDSVKVRQHVQGRGAGLFRSTALEFSGWDKKNTRN